MNQGHVTNIHAVSLEKKVFHNDKRFASDHRTTESINATMREWDNLIPCKFLAEQSKPAESNTARVQAVAAS